MNNGDLVKGYKLSVVRWISSRDLKTTVNNNVLHTKFAKRVDLKCSY